MTNVIIFFVGFILAVIIGQKFKVNLGFVAIAFGFIISWTVLKTTSTKYIAAFPTTLFWNYAMPVIFYAFAQANGTLGLLGKKIAYAFRNARWALPFAIMIMAAVVAGSGASTNNTFMVAPLAWSLAVGAEITPILVPIALWCGSFIGGFLPWTTMGSLWNGNFSTYLINSDKTTLPDGVTPVDPLSLTVRLDIYQIIMALVFIAVAYVICKGWKVKEGTQSLFEKPEDYNKDQKATLVIIVCIICCLLIPSVLNTLFFHNKNVVFKWMVSNLTVPVTSAIGITLVCLFAHGNVKETFGKFVNWNMILTITGMGMYCTLAGKNYLNVVDPLSELLQNAPAFIIPAALCLIGALLSFVTSASTIQALVLAMIPAISAATGLSMVHLATAAMMGTAVTSFSPISTGGAACLIGAPSEVSTKLFPKMIAIAVGLMVAASLLGLIGFYGIGA